MILVTMETRPLTSLFYQVSDDSNYGNIFDIISFIEKRVNKPPVVEISPKNGTTYTLPVATVILDASGE